MTLSWKILLAGGFPRQAWRVDPRREEGPRPGDNTFEDAGMMGVWTEADRLRLPGDFSYEGK